MLFSRRGLRALKIGAFVGVMAATQSFLSSKGSPVVLLIVFIFVGAIAFALGYIFLLLIDGGEPPASTATPSLTAEMRLNQTIQVEPASIPVVRQLDKRVAQKPLRKDALTIGLSVVAVVTGGIIVHALWGGFFDSPALSKREKELFTAERRINSMVPQMLGDDTRLDGAKAGPGNRITYIYTLVSVKASEVDPSVWRNKTAAIRQNMKQTPATRSMFESGTTVVFRYRGIDGGLIGEVQLTPSEALSK